MPCCRVKEENKAETGIILDEKFEDDANEAYFYFFFKDLGLNINNLSSSGKNDNNNQDYLQDLAPSFQKKTHSLFIDISSSFYYKEKFLKIFAKDFSISKEYKVFIEFWQLLYIIEKIINFVQYFDSFTNLLIK